MGKSGFHEASDRDEEIVGSSDRAFGVTIGCACVIIGGARLFFAQRYGWWWLVAAAVVLVLALLRPAALAPLNRVWLRFGLLLYKVVNPVVMALVFYTTVIPIGLLMRASGKDPLRLRRDPAAESYWIRRDPPGPAPSTMKNQF